MRPRAVRLLGATLPSVLALASGCVTAPVTRPVAAGSAAPAAVSSGAPAPVAVAKETPDAEWRRTPPPPGPEPQFQVPPFRRFKLKNGLEVILAQFHDLPLIEMTLVVKSGGGANPPDRAGLSDMTANMLDEGTRSRNALKIADEITTLGAALTTGSTWDASTITLTTLTKNLDPALAVWADVVQNPSFDEKEFVRVRDNLLTAITRRKDSPPTVASLALHRLLYGQRHPYAWPQTGVEETLKKLTTAELRKFYEAHYRPNNSVLIVAGDVGEAALRSKLEPALKGWVVPLKVAPPTAPPKTTVYLIDKADAPQSSIRVGLVGIQRTSPDYIPTTVMNLILGGGFYRLDLNLREGKGWTYGARSSFDARKTPGPFSAGGEFVSPHSAASVEEIIKEIKEITMMREGDVTDAELGRAKDQMIKSFPARFATRASVVSQLAEIAVYGLPDSYLRDLPRKIAAVTKEDIRRMARKHLDPTRLTVVVVGDRKTLQEGLAKIARVELRDLDGEPLGPSPAAKTDSASGKED
jgi:zinc protease